MYVLNGKILARKIKGQLKKEIAKLKTKPGLAVILVGKNEASRVYINQKEKMAQELGVNFKKYLLPTKTSQKKIIDLIKKLNKDKKIQGILAQLPLPKYLNTNKIIQTINPKKDVDGFYNPSVIPPTISGILELLKSTKLNLKNKKACLLTKNDIFTRSLKFFLKKKGLKIINQTNPAHNLSMVPLAPKLSRTGQVMCGAKKADILIVALGKPEFVKAKMIKKGAIIIDVGYSRIKGKPIGDVDFKSVARKAKFITPVPGGVGPLTVIFLFKNLIRFLSSAK